MPAKPRFFGHQAVLLAGAPLVEACFRVPDDAEAASIAGTVVRVVVSNTEVGIVVSSKAEVVVVACTIRAPVDRVAIDIAARVEVII